MVLENAKPLEGTFVSRLEVPYSMSNKFLEDTDLTKKPQMEKEAEKKCLDALLNSLIIDDNKDNKIDRASPTNEASGSNQAPSADVFEAQQPSRNAAVQHYRTEQSAEEAGMLDRSTHWVFENLMNYDPEAEIAETYCDKPMPATQKSNCPTSKKDLSPIPRQGKYQFKPKKTVLYDYGHGRIDI